jgi:hypothetical protein
MTVATTLDKDPLSASLVLFLPCINSYSTISRDSHFKAIVFHTLCAVCGGNTTVATTLDKDPVSYPPDSLLTDSCDVYGNGSTAAPSTYWVGSSGTAGHTVTLTLPCSVTIDRLDPVGYKFLLVGIEV